MTKIQADPFLTQSDHIVLRNLLGDVQQNGEKNSSKDKPTGSSADASDIDRLKAFNDPNHPDFTPTVFTQWDDKDIPEVLNRYLVRPYARLAMKVVRHPTDVVFLTNILMYCCVNLPSAILLYRHFTYLHAAFHVAFTFWCTGPFTLMLHNHIHNNGVLAKRFAVFDLVFPYIFEPLLGHTWDSYYYHHVKHHHVEGNGPDDLSSTIRYQRDSVRSFLHYVGRFLFLIWLDLPMYFIRKNKPVLALRAFGSEMANYAFVAFMTFYVNTRASIFVLVVPFVLLRLGLMVGNWGQHALVDELEPDSDYRSSITLIDVPSNRFCFNDGYHTAHHLNPRRHWREQPVHFLQQKPAYTTGRALVFTNIDYLMMTLTLLRKDYDHLARCLVPLGPEQAAMSHAEIVEMLKTKTRRFSEEEIRAKFAGANAPAAVSKEGKAGAKKGASGLAGVVSRYAGKVNVPPIGTATLEVVPEHRKAE